VTNIVPGLNDDDAQIKDIAAWIHRELGELTPWHVTRFQPGYQLDDAVATPLETLERAAEIGARSGLKFVYLGNVPGHPSETTRCPGCGRAVIQRQGYRADADGLRDDRCTHCDAEINVVTGKEVTP
jgi:pyruvate formate lyase activating enzyme